MTHPDSVFLGYARDGHRPVLERKLLMVRRNDDHGSWYLPGGGHLSTTDRMRESLATWLERQTSLRHTEAHDAQYVAHWRMSNGSITRLLQPPADLPGDIGLSPRHGDTYVREIGWKTHADIVSLHQQELTPWAQFKMAMVALDLVHYIYWNDQPQGDSFADEFRAHDQTVWVHPKFR